MIKFTKDEETFLQSIEEARIATSHSDIPHVKPVSYIFHNGHIFIATDYQTRTYKNLKINPRTSVTIDIYESGKHKAVCIQGRVEILEKGEEFFDIYKKFEDKFAWVRNDPWKENEAPFLKIMSTNKISWGINKNRKEN